MRAERLWPEVVRAASVATLALLGARLHAAEPMTLQAALTISGDLSDRARRALLDEAAAIWNDAGIRLEWLEGVEEDASRRMLRVVVARRPISTNSGDSWVVGELLRYETGEAVALASIPRAEAVVRAAGSGPAHVLPESVVQHRVGIVLGRAVAHEIGHYLLDSRAHTSHGLMRASFQPREFTDLRPGTFALDELSRQRVVARLDASVTTIARADRPSPGAATPWIPGR